MSVRGGHWTHTPERTTSMYLHGPTVGAAHEIVVFQWSTRWGTCNECGLPAAFWIPRVGLGSKPDEWGVPRESKRCAVCAANAAVDGETVARIEPEESSD